ncbi:MAG: type II toxin-antitoxin system HicA family toxin [Planctomycetia bacterium]
MPAFGPISRRELVRCLRVAGFEGPFAGGRHAFMTKGDLTLVIPNPHQADISHDLPRRLLRQAGISREQWQTL